MFHSSTDGNLQSFLKHIYVIYFIQVWSLCEFTTPIVLCIVQAVMYPKHTLYSVALLTSKLQKI